MLTPPASNKTFFQQKWLAKSLTRAYHGEQIREGQWTRMFDRRMPAVVPMDYRVLARTDGSDQAAGRGSGIVAPQEQDDDSRGGRKSRRAGPQPKTPYMHMTYHPAERRLDTAIFRALFASSARQARQFVVHGFVKVNGKKVRTLPLRLGHPHTHHTRPRFSLSICHPHTRHVRESPFLCHHTYHNRSQFPFSIRHSHITHVRILLPIRHPTYTTPVHNFPFLCHHTPHPSAVPFLSAVTLPSIRPRHLADPSPQPQMQYPGYLLNPGDMFSVDPERVLFATGARKHDKTSPETRQGVTATDENDLIVDDDAEDLLEDGEAGAEAEAESDAAPEADAAAAEESTEAADEAESDVAEDPRKALRSLLRRAKKIITENQTVLSAKRKQELRAFTSDIKKTLSKVRGTTIDAATPLEDTIEALAETLDSINAKVPGANTTAKVDTTASAATAAPSSSAKSSNPQLQDGREDAYNARKDAELLHAALARAQENPVDVRKPYATPWRPREYMSAFAFIPRYLEVNQKICTAVYLRHPVARPGLAEIPTPFSTETMGLAFNWYLRRR